MKLTLHEIMSARQGAEYGSGIPFLYEVRGLPQGIQVQVSESHGRWHYRHVGADGMSEWIGDYATADEALAGLQHQYEHEASREWIRSRLQDLARQQSVRIESEFLEDAKLLGQILVVRSQDKRIAEEISSSTLDDLHADPGEQARMERLLGSLIGKLTK